MPKMSLKALRVNAGYTQKSFAKALKRSNKTVAKWEKGLSFPDAKDIDKICELLKVSYDNINFLPNDSL